MSNNSVSVFIIVICVILSAYFSATETAFASLNRIRMKNMADKGNKKAVLVLKLLEKYDSLLSTILIGNNLVNIGATSLATVIFVRMLGEDRGSGVATLVITLILLIFGEISPKSMATEFPETFAMFAAPFLRVCMIVMTPLNFLFGLWKKLLAKLIKGQSSNAITEEELLTIVDEAQDEGEIGEQERTLIRNSIEFADLEAQDILTPRVDIVGVELHDDVEEIAHVFAETGYSRLPVYLEDLDHIKGILYHKDFYNRIYGTDRKISSIIKPAMFVSEHKNIGELLRELQKKKLHIAVVIDEYGGTAGIVTMEDILEEIVGEIWDEHDEVVEEIRKVNDHEYLVMGNTNLDKLFEELDCEEDDDLDTTSVSGWVLAIAGHVPKVGEEFNWKNLNIMVLEMDGNGVERVRVRVRKEPEKEE